MHYEKNNEFVKQPSIWAVFCFLGFLATWRVERKHRKAIIEWNKDKDLNRFPLNEWLRDMVVIFGEVVGKIIYGDAWTVLVRVTDAALPNPAPT